MTVVDTGTYGAKRQSYRKASPRDLLKRLMDENSNASEQKLQKMFSDKASGDPDMIDAIIEYWFANNYRSLVQKPPPAVTAKAKAERTTKVEAIKQTIKVAATRMVLLDMVLPNGKALRDATGRECAKAGGWLTKLAAGVKPADKVGTVLSEAQVRKIFQQA